MVPERKYIQFFLALTFLLLPIAHLKTVVLGIPLYSVEMPVGASFLIYIYGCTKNIFSPLKSLKKQRMLFLSIGLFCVGVVTSFFFNPFSLTGLGMIKTWFLVPILFVWLWIETKPEEKDRERMLLLWFLSICGVAFSSLGYFVQGNMTFDGRLSAWYASPNYLAFFLAPGVLLASYFFSHFFSREDRYKKYMTLGGAFLLLFVLFQTHSYTAWISVFLSWLFFLFLERKNTSLFQRMQKLFLLVCILLSFFLLESGSEKWQSLVHLQERSSIASRIMIWDVAIQAIKEHPFWGIGIGRFQEVYLAYQSQFPLYLEWAVPQPHNLFLALWLETGIIGLISFLFLIIFWAKNHFLLRKKTEDKSIKKRSALFLAFLTSFLLIGFFDTPFFKTDLAFFFWMMIGLGLIQERDENVC